MIHLIWEVGSRLSKTALIFIYIYNNILHILYIYVLVHKVIFFMYIYIYSYIIQHVCFSFSIFISLHSFLELLPSQVLALPNSVLPLSSSALAAIYSWPTGCPCHSSMPTWQPGNLLCNGRWDDINDKPISKK